MELVYEYANKVILLHDKEIAYQGEVILFLRKEELLQKASIKVPISYSLQSQGQRERRRHPFYDRELSKKQPFFAASKPYFKASEYSSCYFFYDAYFDPWTPFVLLLVTLGTITILGGISIRLFTEIPDSL